MKENIKAVLFDVDRTSFDRGLAQGKVLEIIVRRFSHILGAFEIERVAKAFAESDRVATEEFEAGARSNSLRRKRSRLLL
jgi:phosphoglycolate phosphatase-like HAD superfamily hydrolase